MVFFHYVKSLRFSWGFGLKLYVVLIGNPYFPFSTVRVSSLSIHLNTGHLDGILLPTSLEWFVFPLIFSSWKPCNPPFSLISYFYTHFHYVTGSEELKSLNINYQLRYKIVNDYTKSYTYPLYKFRRPNIYHFPVYPSISTMGSECYFTTITIWHCLIQI